MRPLSDAPPAAIPQPGQGRRSFMYLLLSAAIYLGVLLYVDRGTGILSRLAGLSGPLALCATLVMISFGLRYQRWRGALRSQEHGHTPWWNGLRAYLTGFAFTASPGKAGELLRIRYFSKMQVPPSAVLANFIYERGLDLLVVTVLGIGAAALVPAFGTLIAVVLVLLCLLCMVTRWQWLQAQLQILAARFRWAPLRRLLDFLLDGARKTGPLLRLPTLLPGIAWGTLAWILTAVAFAYLCSTLGLSLRWYHALGIYPVAMLAGAVSFVPGGVGTTEAAIVLMLAALGVGMDVALAAAVGIRLISMWMAVMIGMLAVLSFELSRAWTRQP